MRAGDTPTKSRNHRQTQKGVFQKFFKNKKGVCMIATNEFRTVSILGTEYTILPKKYGEEDIDGETDFSCRNIYLREDNVNGIGDFLEMQKNVLRHEIIHAFMY